MARRPYSQLVGPPARGKHAVNFMSPALARVMQRQDTGADSCPPISGDRPSEAIKSIEYSEKTRRLMLSFPSGRKYAYFDVTPERYEALCEADSKGRYFNSVIRDKYAYAKIG